MRKFGPEHHNWRGDDVQPRQGRQRARSWYREQKVCEECHDPKKKTERHHRDGNPLNNVPSNIEFTCRSCHMKVDGRFKGRRISDEQKAKQSAAMTGRTLSTETREKISAAMRGVKKSDAMKAKLVEVARKAWAPGGVLRIRQMDEREKRR